MNNIASILILVLLAITFIQSGYDKLFDWKENLDWLKQHLPKRHSKSSSASASKHLGTGIDFEFYVL